MSVNPMIFYQKPTIGRENGDIETPVQILFPSGGFRIGISQKTSTNNTEASEFNVGVLASSPVSDPLDHAQKLELKYALVIIGVLNIILTCLLFSLAEVADLSKVEENKDGFPTAFEKVPNERRWIETVHFGFTIGILSLGVISGLLDFALGLSAFSLGIILNFILGTASIPHFLYASRYILDVVMLYNALLLRSRLMYTFLPLLHQR